MQGLRQTSLYMRKVGPWHLNLVLQGRTNNFSRSLTSHSRVHQRSSFLLSHHNTDKCTNHARVINPQFLTNCRLFSFGGDSKKVPDGKKDGDEDKDVSDKKETESSPGIMKRFKDTYKTYGKLLIVVHTVTSCVWYGSFYYAAVSGVDIVPLLQKIGFSQTIIGPFQQSGLGHFAVAYLLYKLATPARYTVTVVGTQLSARKLRDLGIMKPIPEGSSLRELANESRDKVRGVQSEMKEKIRQRHEELKEDIKDTKEKFKEDIKDTKDKFKEEFKDTTEKAKQKAEEFKDKLQEMKEPKR